MNDMEEEIDRIEKISYMKINNHYNSQIAYTIKQGYTCIVYITCVPLFYSICKWWSLKTGSTVVCFSMQPT